MIILLESFIQSTFTGFLFPRQTHSKKYLGIKIYFLILHNVYLYIKLDYTLYTELVTDKIVDPSCIEGLKLYKLMQYPLSDVFSDDYTL